MARITIGVGVVLIALGLIGYFPDQASWTALIPAIFGVILAILGGVAMQPNLRKHAMHVAVMVGLIGFLAGVGRGVPVALSGASSIAANASMEASPQEPWIGKLQHRV